MARDLEYFRGMMADASDATKAALFQSAAFRSSSAAMVLADRDLRITLTNAAYDRLATEYEAEFRQALPRLLRRPPRGPERRHLPRDAQRNRRMVADRAPCRCRPTSGSADRIMQLRINGIEDEGGTIAGYVVEWTDVTVQRRDAAVLKGLEARQIGMQFDAGLASPDGQRAPRRARRRGGRAGRAGARGSREAEGSTRAEVEAARARGGA
jgi:methyl-accepting chemotaxis protein